MSIQSSETSAKASLAEQEQGFLGFLRAASLVAVVAGALGSIGLMLRVGHRKEILLLLILFALWVLAPFAALVCTHRLAKRWAVVTRATLHGLMIVIAVGAVSIYGYVALGPPRAQPAFAFLVVPLGSWLLPLILVPLAALVARKQAGRNNGV